MAVEEAQAIEIKFDGAPGVGLDERGKERLEFVDADIVGTAVDMVGQAAHGACVGIDGLVGLALQG